MTTLNFAFHADAALRIDLFLVQKTGMSRQSIQELIKGGHIKRNGQLVTKASQKLKAGDEVSGEYQEEVKLGLEPVAYPLDVIFEDDAFLILNKPQGVVVHPASGHRGPTLVHYVLHYLKQEKEFSALSTTRPGIVHRLDRGTSGLILIAKNRKVQEALSQQFKLRQIKKEYESISWGQMKERGQFRSKIGRDEKNRKKMSSRTLTGRDALTHWERARAFKHFTHVRLFPQTGRTHQLRVHLSEAGFPIVGDSIYGKKTWLKQIPNLPTPLRLLIEATQYPFLHARRLTLTHPLSQEIVVAEAPRPREFDDMLSRLEELDS